MTHPFRSFASPRRSGRLARAAVFGLALAAGLAAAGCSVPTNHGLTIQAPTGLPQGDRGVAVDVENFNGSVTVLVDRSLTRPQADVSVTDVGTGFMRRTDDATVQSWYTADYRLRDGRPTLRVLTTRTDDTLPPTRVSLIIRVPSSEGVRIRNTGGRVELRGVAGPIAVENGYRGGVGGDVLVITNERLADTIDLSTTSGDIELRLAPTASGKIELLAPKGDIMVEARGQDLNSVKQTAKTWTGQLGQGGSTVKLRSGDGDVRLSVGTALAALPAS